MFDSLCVVCGIEYWSDTTNEIEVCFGFQLPIYSLVFIKFLGGGACELIDDLKREGASNERVVLWPLLFGASMVDELVVEGLGMVGEDFVGVYN